MITPFPEEILWSYVLLSMKLFLTANRGRPDSNIGGRGPQQLRRPDYYPDAESLNNLSSGANKYPGDR